VRRGAVDLDWLAGVEARNNLFPSIDYRVYRPRP
jgi:1,4-alpha-glucan branching enzyme